MNQLVHMTATATLLTQVAGCVIETTQRDGDGGSSQVATITARWALVDVADGATTACPAGYDTVALFAQAIDASGNATAAPSSDLFACSTGAGVSANLPPDRYHVWLEVRSHDLATLYAQSLPQDLEVVVGDTQFSTSLFNDGGYFQLSWDLVGAMSHQVVGCAQVVGLDRIETISTSATDARAAYDDAWICEAHAAVTNGVLDGSYTISITAMSSGAPLGAAVVLTGELIAGRNTVTDLGHVLLPIDEL